MIRIRGTRRSAALAAALALAFTLPYAAAQAGGQPSPQGGPTPAAAPVCKAFAAGNPYLQTRVAATSDASTYASTAWANLACGALQVTLPRGRRGLLVVHVDGEVTCTGADGQWCLGRVRAGGIVGEPAAPEPDSFSWANSEENQAQWEANAFTRTRYLACPANHPFPLCVWPVTVQVRTHAAGLLFRVDDSTVHAQVTYY